MLVFWPELSAISGVFRPISRLRTATSDRIPNAAQKTQVCCLEDYLIDSLGISKAAAISACSKYKVKHAHLKNPKSPDLVVNLFKDYGFEETQIVDIVSSVPQILTFRVNSTLKPKLRVLLDLGLSGSDLVSFIKRNPTYFSRCLKTIIVPMVDCLRELLGSDEKTVVFIQRACNIWYFSNEIVNSMVANVALMKNRGVPIDRIEQMIVRSSWCILSRTKDVEEIMSRVEEEMGTACYSPEFVNALEVSFSLSKLALEEKMEVFRSFGWSSSEIASLIRAQSCCFSYSTSRIRDKLTFFMTDLQYTPSYLARYHCLFTYSLEKRIKPRYKIFKILKEKKLVKEKPSFLSLTTYTEAKFLAFIRRFQPEVPGLSKTYSSSIKKTRTRQKSNLGF